MLFIVILAEMANIVSELGFTSSKYRQLLRDLNSLMREHLFPTDLRYRLRQYLRFRHMQQEVRRCRLTLSNPR
jgi:hypothetical protein